MSTARKEFYARLRWRLDADFRFDNGFRVVQFTPPGSGYSIQFDANVTSVAPGSAQSLYLVVSDIVTARDELLARAADVSEVFHPGVPGAHFQSDGSGARLTGPAPDHTSYRSYATFSDPDGNSWLLQEVTTRLPGHVDRAGATFVSANDLAIALRRAEAAHGEHEKRVGQRDANWSDWYATYMVAEQSGQILRNEQLIRFGTSKEEPMKRIVAAVVVIAALAGVITCLAPAYGIPRQAS